MRTISQRSNYRVSFRRRRDGLTNYRYRDRLLRSGLPRAVVRKTLTSTIVQFVEFTMKGDRIIASANATELKKFGWQGSTSNTGAAYLTGLLAGSRAKAKSVEKAVLDIGLQSPAKGSKVFSALKGMLDAGIEIPHGSEILPDEARIKGKIADFDSLSKKIREAKAEKTKVEGKTQ